MKNYKFNIQIIILMLLTQTACVTNYNQTPQPVTSAPMAIQAVKSITLDDSNRRQVFDASLATLQNAGYRIDNTNARSGFISAKSTASMQDARYKATELTLFVTKSGANKTSIRINALRGNQPINDGAFYQSLFTSIQENIFTAQTLAF